MYKSLYGCYSPDPSSSNSSERVVTKPGFWTLDSGLDYGMGYEMDLILDSILDSVLDLIFDSIFGLDSTIDSVLALPFKADYEC